MYVRQIACRTDGMYVGQDFLGFGDGILFWSTDDGGFEFSHDVFLVHACM